MAQVNNFDGGLSLRIDPSLIKVNEAQRLINVDPNPVILRSGKAFTPTNTSVFKSFHNFQNNWVSSDNHRDYVEYENKLYYTEENGVAKSYNGVETKNLGLVKPEPSLAFDANNIPILDEQGEQFNGIAAQAKSFADISLSIQLTGVVAPCSGASLPIGVYNYRITLTSDGHNVHSIDKSVGLTGTENAVRIHLVAHSGLTVRVYREYDNGIHGAKYYRRAELVLDRDRTIVDCNIAIDGSEEFTSAVDIKGAVQYTMTYYNADDDVESAPMSHSREVTVTKGDRVLISNLPVIIDSQVTHKRIYRLGGNLVNMTLVAEVAPGISSFYDYTSDVNATKILDTQNNYPPENSMHSLTEMYSIFFGIVGNELRFSKIDEPNAWPPENSIKLRQNGTGLLVIPQGLLVFTKTKTYLLTGTSKSQFRLTLISEQQGCLTNKSCQVVKNAPLWVSHDGICTIESGYVSVISKPLLGKTSFSITQSIVYDEQYFLLKADGSLFVLDMRSGFRFYMLNYEVAIDGLAVHDGLLYFASGGKLCTAFTGGELRFQYTSPVYIESNHAEAKMYHHVYIRADGTFTVKFYIDGELALTKELSGNKTFDLMPPTDKQRGYACHFEIEGLGTVYTLNTKPLGVQNGRV